VKPIERSDFLHHITGVLYKRILHKYLREISAIMIFTERKSHYSNTETVTYHTLRQRYNEIINYNKSYLKKSSRAENRRSLTKSKLTLRSVYVFIENRKKIEKYRFYNVRFLKFYLNQINITVKKREKSDSRKEK